MQARNRWGRIAAAVASLALLLGLSFGCSAPEILEVEKKVRGDTRVVYQESETSPSVVVLPDEDGFIRFVVSRKAYQRGQVRVRVADSDWMPLEQFFDPKTVED